MVVSCLMWVLGTESCYLESTSSALTTEQSLQSFNNLKFLELGTRRWFRVHGRQSLFGNWLSNLNILISFIMIQLKLSLSGIYVTWILEFLGSMLREISHFIL